MIELSIKFSNQRGSVKINRMAAGTERNLQKGLGKLGVYMERQLKRTLKTSNPTKFFYKSQSSQLRSRTSALRDSITSELFPLTVKIGPAGPPAIYGMANETGAIIPVTEKMRRFLHSQGIHLRASTTEIILPARPWFWPTWKQHRTAAIDIVRREVMKPLE